jgi:hypothetical protein
MLLLTGLSPTEEISRKLSKVILQQTQWFGAYKLPQLHLLSLLFAFPLDHLKQNSNMLQYLLCLKKIHSWPNLPYFYPMFLHFGKKNLKQILTLAISTSSSISSTFSLSSRFYWHLIHIPKIRPFKGCSWVVCNILTKLHSVTNTTMGW